MTGIGLASDGYYESSGSAAGPAVPTYPTITIVSPLSPNPLLTDTPIVFDVNDLTGLREVFVYVGYAGGEVWEVVHDGLAFSPTFSGPDNTRVVITNGYQYTILRDGGWPAAPKLRVIPVNVQGNLPL